jgi:hypothetical protein
VLNAAESVTDAARDDRGAARRLLQAPCSDPMTLLTGCELSYIAREGGGKVVLQYAFQANVHEYDIPAPSEVNDVFFLASTDHAVDVDLTLQGSDSMQPGASLCPYPPLSLSPVLP